MPNAQYNSWRGCANDFAVPERSRSRSVPQGRAVQVINLVRYRYANRPNPLTPFPFREGGKFKASLLLGERFGERSKLCFTRPKTAIQVTNDQ
jgi:hypothetical protein